MPAIVLYRALLIVGTIASVLYVDGMFDKSIKSAIDKATSKGDL